MGTQSGQGSCWGAPRLSPARDAKATLSPLGSPRAGDVGEMGTGSPGGALSAFLSQLNRGAEPPLLPTLGSCLPLPLAPSSGQPTSPPTAIRRLQSPLQLPVVRTPLPLASTTLPSCWLPFCLSFFAPSHPSGWLLEAAEGRAEKLSSEGQTPPPAPKHCIGAF